MADKFNFKKQRAARVEQDNLVQQLQERVKRLDCIRAISDIAANPTAPLDEILQNIADIIPLGFRASKSLCACISIFNNTIKTANFKNCQSKLEADLTVDEKNPGKLEIGYSDSMPDQDSPFLEDEKNLLEAIALRVRTVIRNKILKDSLIKSEKRYRNLVESALVGIIQGNLNGDLLYANPTCLRIFGYKSLEEAISLRSMVRYLNPVDRKTIVKILEQTRNISSFEAECRTKKAEPVFLLISATLESNVITAMMMDITQRKRTDEALSKALEEIKAYRDRLEAENIHLRDEIKLKEEHEDIVARSDPMKYAMYRIMQVACSKVTVLITGETGTGKDVFARLLHRESDRRHKPMVTVNCASLPANLIESELFGREKGAFTGSTARQIGRFELANGGTIFLDEIGEMPIELQAKLLRVLESGEFERLGSPHTVKTNVRVVACTNRNLEDEIKKGRFRKDLFYRLNVFPVTLPPLRERKEDIPLLVKFYTDKFSISMGKKITVIPKSIMKILEDYSWPGNVRELINVIERGVILSNGPVLGLADPLDVNVADSSIGSTGVSLSNAQELIPPKCLAEVERDHILQAMRQTAWRVEGPHGAAHLLGINPSTLRGRIKKLGIKKS